MDAEGRDTLKRAADLIRAGKKNQAQPMLVEFLRDEPNNAQAWYLLSHALGDPKRQQYAVLQALRADPTFERARNRLITLQGGTPKPTATPPAPSFDPVPQLLPKPKTAPLPKTQPAFEQPTPVAKPGAAFFDEEEAQPEATQELRAESAFEDAAPKPKRNFRGVLIVVVLLALVAAAVYFGRDLLAAGITQPIPTATEPQAFRTLPPTWTLSPTPERPTLTPTSAATSTPEQTVGVTLE